MNFILPFLGKYIITQTYAEHKARAISIGCCWKPMTGCQCFYFPGVDYATPIGTPIRASSNGVVTVATTDTSPSGGYGKYVKISHSDGLLTLYSHLSSFIVTVGNNVTQEQVIGYSGYSGNVYPKGVAGAHLHWEMRKDGIPVDPYLYLNSSPIIPIQPEILPPGQPAHVVSSIGANLRDSNYALDALVYYGTQVMITGSPMIINNLQYYPVILNGYIAKDSGNGNIILAK